MQLRKMDKWLLLATVILFAIGLVMVFSASNVAAYMRYSASPFKFVGKQAIILAIGAIASIILLKISTKTYSVLSWGALLAIIGFLAIVLLYGKTTNSATSWINLGIGQVQPSEFLKVIMIMWMASFYEVKRKNLDSYSTSLTPLFICLFATLLIILQPDLGTAIIYGSIVLFIFFIAPINRDIKFKTLGILAGLTVIGCIFLASSGKSIISERQLDRFDLSSPCGEKKFYTDGNQICNAYIALNNGGLFGKGLGNSTQKYLYLPEAHTDFIFAITVEELGLLISIGIILLFMFVLYRIIRIGRRSYNNRGAILCYGIAFYIFMHIMVNLMGIFGMIPMTGVPLPFISYGGSFTLSLIGALVLVQRVAIENKTYEEKQNK